MNQPIPAKSSPRDANADAAPVMEPGFEENLQVFWDKNRSAILLVCLVALLAIIGRESWMMFAAHQEQTVQEEYARTGGQTDKLAAFADANSDHSLAGVAYLQVADDNFAKADYKLAATNYQKALPKLKNDALVARARLGAAMSLLASGDASGGESALKAVSSDPTLSKGVRAEAAYHLASLASEAGKTDDVKKYTDDLNKIDASSVWAQRATLLMVGSPATSSPVPGLSAPQIKITPAPKN